MSADATETLAEYADRDDADPLAVVAWHVRQGREPPERALDALAEECADGAS